MGGIFTPACVGRSFYIFICNLAALERIYLYERKDLLFKTEGEIMSKRKELVNRIMTDFFEIPKDLVLDLPKITIIGRNELYLENHRGVIEYNLNRLRINLVRGFLEIEGKDLVIKALLAEEMSIVGEFYSIRFMD